MRHAVGLALVLSIVPCAVAQQRTFVDQLDSSDIKWSIRFLPSGKRPVTTVVQHRSEKSDWNQTGRVEVLRLRTAGQNQQSVLAYPLPPARPFDELRLKVRVKSTQAGLRLAARVVFVDHENPGTGKPFTAMIRGESYRSVGEWQELECVLDGPAVSRALRDLRVRTSLPLVTQGHTYVDTATIICDLNPGNAEVAIDSVSFGPIIAPHRVIDLASSESSGAPATRRSAAEIRLGQLRVNDRPFFPRIAVYHGESIDMLRYSGVNSVLVPDGTDTQLIDQLRAAGFRIAAVPPTLDKRSPTSFVSDSKTSISDDDRIQLWYLGTSIGANEQADLVDWTRWLKSSDPLRRPIMADVASGERVFSRYVNMLGVSRSIAGTSVSLRDYRNSLLQRRSLAQPGKFMWTWLHTSHGANEWTDTVEPEQLRLQAYAAIASGSKAIGYWSTENLLLEGPAGHERLLAMRRLNQEFSLIEDWLAVGDLVGHVRCEAGAAFQPARRRSTTVEKEHEAEKQRRQNTLASLTNPNATRKKTNVEAAVFKTPYGQLLLPVWYSNSAQFVPGEMVANDLSLVVHAPQAERSAWMVTPTSIRSLRAEKQEGGLRIQLSTADNRTVLDQTAIVVVTSRDDVLAELRNRVAAIASEAAHTTVELASSKLTRVRLTENALAVADGHATQILNQSEQAIGSAQAALGQSNYDSARMMAQRSMQYLRRLQYHRWATMTRNLSSPVASPYATAYSTLPLHNVLTQHLRSTAPSRAVSLFPRVTAQNTALLKNTGWSRFPDPSETIRAKAQFGRGGERYFLMLSAAAANRGETPEIIARPPIRVTSPVVNVRSGELVRVSGRVRVPSAIAANVDGAMLFDNLSGPDGALRWGEKTRGWVPFELVRRANADGGFYVTVLLAGLGSVQVSDLNVEVFPPMSMAGTGQSGN